MEFENNLHKMQVVKLIFSVTYASSYFGEGNRSRSGYTSSNKIFFDGPLMENKLYEGFEQRSKNFRLKLPIVLVIFFFF